MLSQIQFLLTTKIFTAKDRLNGGGKIANKFGLNSLREASNQQWEIFARSVNECIVEKFIRENKLGIISMEQTDDWSWRDLFLGTYKYWAEQMGFIQIEEEGLYNFENLGKEILNTLDILEMISEKLMKEMEILNAKPTPKYYEDPDDPLIEKIVILSFVECPNYQTTKGPVTFNLNYVLDKIEEATSCRYTQKALEEITDLPPNEYKWWDAPLNMNQ
jgi:hypothetical protein